ncbi:THO complex subunit [Trichinella spiralis]|uniref:THO complex subunit n=2 Tax=Trichinella spiralis TaxID=6334 RepID=A0ABR3KM45_TRISP
MGHRRRRNSGRRRSHRRWDADVLDRPAQTHQQPVVNSYESRTADETEPHADREPHIRPRLNNHHAGSRGTRRRSQQSADNHNKRKSGRVRGRRSRDRITSAALENGGDPRVPVLTSDGRRPSANNNRRTDKLRHVDARVAETHADGRLSRTDGRLSRADGRLSRADGRPSRSDGRPSRSDGRPSRSDGRLSDCHHSSPPTGHLSSTAGQAHVRTGRTRAGTGGGRKGRPRLDESRSSNSRRMERPHGSKRTRRSSTRRTTAATSNTARGRTRQARMRRDALETGLDRVDSNPDRTTGRHWRSQLNRHDQLDANTDAPDADADTDSLRNFDENNDDLSMREVTNVDIRNMGSMVAGQSFFKVKNFKSLSSTNYIRLKMLKRFERLYRKGCHYEESLLRKMRSTTVEPPVDETIYHKSILIVSRRRFHRAKC